MPKFTSRYATTSVEIANNSLRLKHTDSEALDFHETEADAMRAVEQALRSGDQTVALLRVEALFQAEEIKLSRIE